jgi:hypothetical protein
MSVVMAIVVFLVFVFIMLSHRLPLEIRLEVMVFLQKPSSANREREYAHHQLNVFVYGRKPLA